MHQNDIQRMINSDAEHLSLRRELSEARRELEHESKAREEADKALLSKIDALPREIVFVAVKKLWPVVTLVVGGLFGGGYAATQDIKTTTETTTKVVSRETVEELQDAKLKRLFAEARAEGRKERDAEVLAAAIESRKREVEADRAANMRVPTVAATR